jgi:hypothetical protein
MRWGMIVAALCLSSAFAADQPQSLAPLPCMETARTGHGCDPSKADLKKAKDAFSKGVHYEKSKRFDDAYHQFDEAARLAPKNIDYLTALAMSREQLIYDHMQRGNEDLLASKQIEAQAEFRSALDLDPDNVFAKQQLNQSLGEWEPKAKGEFRIVENAGELHPAPNDLKADFHFRGDSRALLAQVASVYGINAQVDDSVPSRRVHFDIDSVDFFAAMNAACLVTGAFWTPLSEKEIYLLKDSAENHRQFDRMALRSFYVPTATPQDLNQLVNTLRVIFEVRFLSLSVQTQVVEVRAPVPVLDAITELLEKRDETKPQVVLEMNIYEIDHQLTRNMGIHIPNNFNLFNIPAAALAALGGGQNIQDLINQLISGGGINQANSQAISGLLAQLQGQSNSIFSQPLATFGGGLTLFGLSLDQLSGELSMNESWVKHIQSATFRVAQNNDTNFKIGSRYPILNASFAPVFNNAAISQVIQNNSFEAPFPSFSYEDIGLVIKAKPTVNSNLDVGLALEVELRTLAGQSLNGVPIIANRQYKGSILLANGEPAVVAGEITNNEQRSLSGIPGLGQVPGLNKIAASNSLTSQSDELLIVITPHVVNAPQPQDAEIWLTQH